MTDYADLANLAAPDNGADAPTSTLDRLRAALLDTAAVRALPPPDSLIDDYLMRDSLATLYGPSGGGKTFLALDWALHTAVFPWWNNHGIHGGPVVYVIAEGVSGVGIRIDAWTGHHATSLDKGHPIYWLPQAVNLTDLGEVYALAELAAELGAVLIVFDTLARCIVGADENSAKDMGVVVANLDRIRRTTGACVLAVHHSGKDGTAGARGSSALRAAMDTELEVTDTDGRTTLKVTKQKDGPEVSPLRLTRTAAGSSCVLVTASDAIDDRELSTGAAATLDTLRTIQVPGGIAAGVWEDASAASRSVFYTHRAKLLRLGLVRNIGTEKMPRYVTADAEFDTKNDEADEPDPAPSPVVGPVVRGPRPPGPGQDQSDPTEQDRDQDRTGPVDQGEQ